jgi:hypothetical protein
MEELGIPAASVVSGMFEENAKAAAYKRGMPLQRISFTPHPVAFQQVSSHRAYTEGNDPITGRPLMGEIVEALTKPLTEEEKKTEPLDRTPPKVVGPDSERNLQLRFLRDGWTDGLPIVLPTEKRVAGMLKGTSHPPDEIMGKMSPATAAHEEWEFTVEKVATNAVMAGAEPEYLPVILAIASTGLTSIPASTTSFARMMVVNGPIRKEIAMNGDVGALGPFNHANATIGRAWTLLSKNLSGAGILGDTYMGSQGNNLSYNNICIAENEEKSPWMPFHVEKGFKSEESVVSIFHGWCIAHGIGVRSINKGLHDHIRSLFGIFAPVSSPTSASGALVLIDPLAAKEIKKNKDLDTKEKLQKWLYQNTLISYDDFWHDELVVSFTLPAAQKGVEPFASWLKQPKDSMLHRFSSPETINLIVVGGEVNPFFQAGDFRYLKSASIDAWR